MMISSSSTSSSQSSPTSSSLFPLLPITSNQTLENCLHFNDNDNNNNSNNKLLFITSYPKSGTTWLQCIVHQLLSRGDSTFSHISDYSPFYEANQTWENEEFIHKYSLNHLKLGMKVFNTHLKWEMLPKGTNVKYIYIYRNGRDVVYSFFQHLSNFADSGVFEGNFDEFFQDWLNCKIIYGSWIKHVKEWRELSQDPANNILLLRYEDLKHNLLEGLVQISNHLEVTFTRQELEEIILPHCTFPFMKEHKIQYEPVSVRWKPGFEFIRKGVVGDSDEIFSEEHRQQYDEMIRKEFPNGIPDWLQDYL